MLNEAKNVLLDPVKKNIYDKYDDHKKAISMVRVYEQKQIKDKTKEEEDRIKKEKEEEALKKAQEEAPAAALKKAEEEEEAEEDRKKAEEDPKKNSSLFGKMSNFFKKK